MIIQIQHPLKEVDAKASPAKRLILEQIEGVEELELRPIFVSDLIAVDDVDGSNARSVVMLSRLTGIHRAALERLDARDMRAAAKAINKLLGE